MYLYKRCCGKLVTKRREANGVGRKETEDFYETIEDETLCRCAYCENYRREVVAAYPLLTTYLRQLGVEIEKPFETMPLEVDDRGMIAYSGVQYIVCGAPEQFEACVVEDVRVTLAGVHPTTGLAMPHFVIEVYPITLPWVMDE